MKRTNRSGLTGLLAAVILTAALLWFFTAVSGLKTGEGEKGRQQLEDALRQAAVACYAAEGIYPPTLDYLTDHYGVQVEDRYIVFYEIFANNLMPEITVLEKGTP